MLQGVRGEEHVRTTFDFIDRIYYIHAQPLPCVGRSRPRNLVTRNLVTSPRELPDAVSPAGSKLDNARAWLYANAPEDVAAGGVIPARIHESSAKQLLQGFIIGTVTSKSLTVCLLVKLKIFGREIQRVTKE